jgi:hypothetical protein
VIIGRLFGVKALILHEKSPPMLIWEAFNYYYGNPKLITTTESHEDSQDVKEQGCD